MAGLREIKRRIGSVASTKKTTYAMKLVAAAKLRKVQLEVANFRNYCNLLSETFLLVDSEKAIFDTGHYLTKQRPVENIAIVVYGGLRGLAGGYNTTLNKSAKETFSSLKREYPNCKISCTLLGGKVVDYFRQNKLPFDKSYKDLGGNFSLWPLGDIREKLLKDFHNEKIDKIFIVYTSFKSAVAQEVVVEQIAPVTREQISQKFINFLGSKATTDNLNLSEERRVIVEPSIDFVVEALLARIVQSSLLFAALNSQASEHGSRMAAMDAATKNAGELMDALKLKYNKLRQSGITAELLDIIGGAEAVS
jgi:F-type H+-transporting ATPase subunit gamma